MNKTSGTQQDWGNREWVSLKEAARLLQYTQENVRRMAEMGLLVAYQPGGPGGQIRITRASVEEALRRPYGRSGG